jgi:hypothetical protein
MSRRYKCVVDIHTGSGFIRTGDIIRVLHIRTRGTNAQSSVNCIMDEAQLSFEINMDVFLLGFEKI